jgi:hypothetical protein
LQPADLGLVGGNLLLIRGTLLLKLLVLGHDLVIVALPDNTAAEEDWCNEREQDSPAF